MLTDNQFSKCANLDDSAVIHKIPKIQIWLVIESTDSENFNFFGSPETKSNRKEKPGFNTQGCRNPFHYQTILLSYKSMKVKFEYETHLLQFSSLLVELPKRFQYSVQFCYQTKCICCAVRMQ